MTKAATAEEPLHRALGLTDDELAAIEARLGRAPNRSESSRATGRAPIDRMSRTIPPTPVAAPWNGSIALGCECDSILNTQAMPPPAMKLSTR